MLSMHRCYNPNNIYVSVLCNCDSLYIIISLILTDSFMMDTKLICKHIKMYYISMYLAFLEIYDSDFLSI